MEQWREVYREMERVAWIMLRNAITAQNMSVRDIDLPVLIACRDQVIARHADHVRQIAIESIACRVRKNS